MVGDGQPQSRRQSTSASIASNERRDAPGSGHQAWCGRYRRRQIDEVCLCIAGSRRVRRLPTVAVIRKRRSAGGREVPLTAVSKCSNVRLRNCGYSITSSRRASWDGGTVILSAFVVFMVIASLYLVGAWTGRSSRKIRPGPHLLQRAQSGERTGGTVARAARLKRRCASGRLSCCR
jgi:hypothetical protein